MSDEPNRGIRNRGIRNPDVRNPDTRNGDVPNPDVRNDRPEESGDPWTRLPSMAPGAVSAAIPTVTPGAAPVKAGSAGRVRTVAEPTAAGPAAPDGRDGRDGPDGPAGPAGPFAPTGRTVAPSPLDPGASRDPHPIHRALREEFPLTYDPLLRAWVLSRYADVAAALTDSRFTHGHRPGDPPCTRAHVDVDMGELRSVTERTAYVLARRIAERPQADLVADFCHWLPAGTVAAAVGVPYRDMMRLVRGRAAGALAGECGGQIAVREKALASFLGNVLADPDQVAALRDAPTALVARAWAESLRRDPPVQIAVRRTRSEVRVSGGIIPAGASVALLVGSAGRDPERFREPDRFDPFRDDPGQLTYGSGFCPAVLLAGLEAEYALRALFTAMPRLRLADGFRPAAHGLITRAPRSLIVRPGG